MTSPLLGGGPQPLSPRVPFKKQFTHFLNIPSFLEVMEMQNYIFTGHSVFLSGDPGVSGDFGGRRKAVRDRFALQGGTGDFP